MNTDICGYLCYFRDLRNGIIIIEGEARGVYCAIPKVSKEHRYPYSCNSLFRLWPEVALSLRVTITNSDFLCVCNAKIQVLAIEFVLLANEFVPLANEFVLLVNEFVLLANEFVPCENSSVTWQLE